MDTLAPPALRLHIGCGDKPLPGWINIDRVARAPGVTTDLDITDLPYADGSVDSVLAEHVFEHFTFAEESLAWREMARVLRPGGILTLEVPDFEWVCETFLSANDDWRSFYTVGAKDDYAGCGRVLDQRWGILQTMFFGNQNGSGQFHHSAYTEAKLRAIAADLGFQTVAVRRLFNKGGQALRARLDTLTMRIFISGIAGFLGSHLAERLLAMGHDVVGCDSLLGGELINVPPEAEFYQYDCRDFNAMAKVMRGAELVYHCAATAYEGLSVFAPAMVMDNIVTGSVAMFSAAVANGARRIVFCSSMARYGTNQVPFLEAYVPRPQDPYGIAKVAAEQALINLASVHGVEYAIAVPHNIIGARQKFDDPYRNVASIMANLMLQGRSPFIYGDGEQMRCFSHIEDCLSCLLALGLTQRGLGEVVNIGPDEEFVSINQLFRKLKDLVGFEGQAIYITDRPQEVKNACCSSTKARALLGYRTTRALDDGLGDIVQYIRAVGPRKFRYHLDIEIRNDRTPRTWTERLM